ncbi:MAG: DUF6076 domain-containing protein, partial [Lachnospirales bacterium]
ILINEQKIPLGQCSTEILNLSDDFLDEMGNARVALSKAVYNLIKEANIRNEQEAIPLQNLLNDTLSFIKNIPPYKFFLKQDFAETLILDCFANAPKDFKEYLMFFNEVITKLKPFFMNIFNTIDEIIAFKTYFHSMLEVFFEDLRKRNSEFYALGFYHFIKDPTHAQIIRESLPDIKSFDFSQSQNLNVRYIPMPNPENDRDYVIAEKINFNSCSSFLYLDFFRALMNGHCPRRCHNCGTYFLLLSGHNTCYCSNPISEQKHKNKISTCRDVGAHNKEREQKENRTPTRQEYDKVYNRLKTRKNRKKISSDEFNDLVSKALSYKDQNENGELSDAKYREIMGEF